MKSLPGLASPSQKPPQTSSTSANGHRSPYKHNSTCPLGDNNSPLSTPKPVEVTLTSTPTEMGDPPDWSDTLDGGKSFYKYENDNTRVTQEGGHLALTGINANGWLGWSLTFSRKPADFRLERGFHHSDLFGNRFVRGNLPRAKCQRRLLLRGYL